MRFGVLGPVEVRDGVRIVPVPSPKVRGLLAALLCAPRRWASVDVLTGALWGESPPRSAADNVRLYVHQLRKALNDTHRVVRDERGYGLVVHPGEVDADIFGELAAQGHDLLAAGEAVKARTALAQALSLWRGCAFAGIPMSSLIEVEAIRLEGQRVSVLGSRIEADLAVGRHVDLIAELTDLTYLHPLHERFPAQLMLALHRSGRRSEALDVYRQTRHRLVAELGIEPGRPLRELEQQILRDSSRLELPMPQPVTAPSRVSFPIPAQLPADLPSFTGRGASLAALDDLRNSAQGSSSAALGLICGGAGIGKTAVAVHWAHRVRSHFPDGQLYVNLHGFSPGVPLRPIQALTRMIRALGVPNERIPEDLEEIASLYRSLVADRRVLILLDNARDAAQVEKLLPGGATTMTLVTSRDRLSGLAALFDGMREDLAPMPISDSVQLLSKILGTARIVADRSAADDFAATCAGLPLALRVAAAQLADEPGLCLAEHARNLRAGNALALLSVPGTDDGAVVMTAFDASFRYLAPTARRVFVAFGFAPCDDLTAPALASLSNESNADVTAALNTLVGASLVDEHLPGRYSCHDLLRLYAGQVAAGQPDAGLVAAGRPDVGEVAAMVLGGANRSAAVMRMCEWYLRGTDTAARLRAPKSVRLPIPRLNDDAEPPNLPSNEHAVAWLDAELPNLVAIVRYAALHHLHPYSYLLADTLRGYFLRRRCTMEWLAVARAGLAGARAAGDRRAAAACWQSLAQAQRSVGRYRLAARHYRGALALVRAEKWAEAEANVLSNLGGVYWELGQSAEAADHVEAALIITRRTGSIDGEATNETNLGSLKRELGQLAAAAKHLRRALTLARRHGMRVMEAHILINLGETNLDDGRIHDARSLLTDGLAVAREVGDRYAEANALVILANLHCATQRYKQGAADARKGLAIARAVGDPRTEAFALSALGCEQLAREHPAKASSHYEAALTVARQIRNPYPQAIALLGLARSGYASDDLAGAAARAELALELAKAAGYQRVQSAACELMDQIQLRQLTAERP